jgi:phosphoglycolate phosphatase
MFTEDHPVAAVLFDFDGTLIDSYPAITASVNHVRWLHGLPPLGVAEVSRHVGRGPGYLLEKTVGTGDPAANAAAYRRHHPKVLREGTHLLPSARETLFALKQRGLKLGVCSNKPVVYTRELIAYLGLADALDVVLGPEEVRRHKPAPDMLLAAMSRLGVRAEQTLYVGDMTVDIQTARGAGVHVWVIATGSDTPEALDAAHPDRRLARLKDLVTLLDASASKTEQSGTEGA